VSALGRLAGAWLGQRSPARRLAAWVLAVAGPTLLTLAALPLHSSLVLGGYLFSALLVVIAVAVLGGVWPALTGVVLSVLERVVFFAPPFESHGANLQPNLVSLVGFAVAGGAAAIVISELALLAEEQASSRRVEAALRRIATLVARAAPEEELFAAVTQEAGRLLAADFARLGRYEPGDWLAIVAAWGKTGDHFPVGSRWPQARDNVSRLAFQPDSPARIGNIADVSEPLLIKAREQGVHHLAGAPIIVSGRPWGVMIAGSIDERPLPPDAEERLASFTELVVTAISNAENLVELTASRARVVAAADETRRRIERDLHDGAQQRLVSLRLSLQAARTAVPPQLGELDGELAHIADGLASALEDLQELARGIHPAILARGGLRPALKTLGRRCTVPVELDMKAEARLPERVEVAAYYVVAEALTNAAKHAQASVIHVSAEMIGHALRLSVRDDGAGGADPVRGTGLTGLKDRVEALGGTITVQSPVGAGTSLQVELPLID
jgi:signal transduction histidine kinase